MPLSASSTGFRVHLDYTRSVHTHREAYAPSPATAEAVERSAKSRSAADRNTLPETDARRHIMATRPSRSSLDISVHNWKDFILNCRLSLTILDSSPLLLHGKLSRKSNAFWGGRKLITVDRRGGNYVSRKLRDINFNPFPTTRGSSTKKMVRKLKYHERKLLKKVDFISWKTDSNVREARILKRYHIERRDDYTKLDNHPSLAPAAHLVLHTGTTSSRGW